MTVMAASSGQTDVISGSKQLLRLSAISRGHVDIIHSLVAMLGQTSKPEIGRGVNMVASSLAA